MSDRTSLTLHVPVVPDERLRPLIVAAFAEFGGGDWHTALGEQETGQILLGANESPVGGSTALAAALRAIPTADAACPLPDFAFQLHEDPAQEWLGDLIIHVPGLARDFWCECDANGQAVLAVGGLDRLVALARAAPAWGGHGDRLSVADRLAELTGAAHREAFRALTPAE